MNSRDCPKWRACLHEVSLKRGVGAGAGGGGGSDGAGAGGAGVGPPGSGRPKPGAGSIFFLRLGLVSTLTLTLKQRSLKRRDLDSGPSTHIPLRSRGLLLGCSERANTR